MKEYIQIGKLAASHGLQGDLVLVHSLGKKTSLTGLEAIFVEKSKDNLLPYFITSATGRTEDETLLKLEGIATKEQARLLTPRPVWLRTEDFQKHVEKAAPIALLGFSLINGKEDLGEIIEIIEQPHQVLCTIMYKGNEALIPVHGDNLLKVDQKGKKVYVDIPEGLLDIYA